MKRHSFLTLFLFLSLSLRILGEDAKKGEVPFKIVSYNVENFFESLPDTSAKNPFSPQGVRRWTKWKYKTKISHISQALLACGEDKIPSLIGLCEIGSEKVLYDLVHSSPLWKLNYDYILAETQDVRHIHTALLYCKEDFRPLEIQSLEVDLSQYTTYRPTRCILYVKGLNTYSQDTLHIFVVHFPSRS
ncbi:MAG TPA: hypothetical protein DDY68_02940 [Porphyromonadaceae bacterium]|nr:hypothetical protein [Porphyromonadaceae bacterium]